MAVAIVAVACGRPAPAPLEAHVSGTLGLPGLAAPVRIVRDRWDVPHIYIYARNRDEVFFAQGVVPVGSTRGS